jgi:predicted ArsR family transcriptional regulator
VENPIQLGPRPTEDDADALAGLSAQRRRVLDTLDRLARLTPGQPVAIATVATELDLHVNTAREHLDGLVSAGLADRSRLAPSGRGRPGWGYAPRTRRSPATAEYVTLARVLADHVAESGGDVRRDMLELGRRWGRSITESDTASDTASGADPKGRQAVAPAGERADDTVVRLLGDLGFDPEVSARMPAVRVRLRRCPMLEVARQRPEVVCQLHRGIVEGVLQAEGARRDVRLDAFAEPGACVLHLAHRDA